MLMPLSSHALRAGKVEVVESKFDGQSYVLVGPGWTKNLERRALDGIFGGDLKVGAMIHSELGAFLILRVDAIVSITGAEVLIGDSSPVALTKAGRTDVETGSENRFDITHSEASFQISAELLKAMASGGKAWIRAHTSEGYIEADFGATCASRWGDRACVGLKKAMNEAKALGILE